MPTPKGWPTGTRVLRGVGQPPPTFVRPRSSATVRASGLSSAASADLGAAVAEALFGVNVRRTPRRLQSQPLIASQPEVAEHVEPILGSVLQFTPVAPGWTAVLVDEDGTPTHEPIVGWVVVVIWAAYSEDNEDETTKGTKQFQTEVQPLTLAADGSIEPVIMRDGLELHQVLMPGMVPLH